MKDQESSNPVSQGIARHNGTPPATTATFCNLTPHTIQGQVGAWTPASAKLRSPQPHRHGGVREDHMGSSDFRLTQACVLRHLFPGGNEATYILASYH